MLVEGDSPRWVQGTGQLFFQALRPHWRVHPRRAFSRSCGDQKMTCGNGQHRARIGVQAPSPVESELADPEQPVPITADDVGREVLAARPITSASTRTAMPALTWTTPIPFRECPATPAGRPLARAFVASAMREPAAVVRVVCSPWPRVGTRRWWQPGACQPRSGIPRAGMPGHGYHLYHLRRQRTA
jgi:hypothetical protein